MLRVPAPRETDAGTEAAPDRGPAFTPPRPHVAPRRLRNASGQAAAQVARRHAAQPTPQPAAIPADLLAEDEDQRADEAEIAEIEHEFAAANADAAAVEEDAAAARSDADELTAHAASAPAVPKTDAGIRRLRARWKRLRDDARQARDRARRRQAEKRRERRERVARRRRLNRRKQRAEERRSHLKAKRRRLERRRERLENRRHGKATARAASVGDVVGDVLDWIAKAIKKVVAAIRKVIDLIAQVARLIVRLIKAITRESNLIGRVIRFLERITRKVVRAAKRAWRWTKKLASKLFRPFGFDRTGPPPGAKGTRNVEGLVFRDEGVDMWPAPEHKGEPLGRLAAGRRVFVINKNLPGGWAHVATDKGSNGYVPASVIRTDLPCPGARLYKIPENRTALRIAQRFYGDQVKPGRDLRFYVNVLQYVNQKNGGPSAIEKPRNSDSWKTVIVYAGQWMWIPTPEFANTLEGVVDDGSITGGLWARAKSAYNTVVDILIGAPAFVYGLLKGAVLTVKETLEGVAQLVGTFIDLVKSLLSGEIIGDIKALWDELSHLNVAGMARGLWADFKRRWNDPNPMSRWSFRGEVVGRVVTEVALTALSGGLTAIASGTSKFARLTAALSHLKSMQKLSKAAAKRRPELTAELSALRAKIVNTRKGSDKRYEEAARAREEARPGSGAPDPLPLLRGKIGRGQKRVLKARIARARADGARDMRVDQQQVGADGVLRGRNRPDLQYTNREGRRVYVEFDGPTSGRGPEHLRRILSNDPDAIIELWKQDRYLVRGRWRTDPKSWRIVFTNA